MTSQLHKKHPTTQQNIPQQTPSKLRFVLPYVLLVFALVCLVASVVSADENPFANEQSSNHRLSPLDRLKSRSAQNRFDKFHSSWKKGADIEVIRPRSTADTAHIVEVIDVEAFKQSPQRHTGESQNMTFHHLFKKEPPTTTQQLPLRTPRQTPKPQPVQQIKEPVNYDERPYEEDQAETKNPRDLKKITEILPYHDYNSEKSSSRKKGELPKEIALSQANYSGRTYPDAFYHWHASNVEYHPLYFEDVQLERYGHEYPHYVQPFVSVTKFGTQLVGLPYQMGINSPRKLVSPLGYYRPGEAAPKLCYQIPLSTKGAALQAGTVTGLIFLIP